MTTERVQDNKLIVADFYFSLFMSGVFMRDRLIKIIKIIFWSGLVLARIFKRK